MSDWDHLKYILAISRHGGLSGAARALGVNHSTVSRRLAHAESRYGVRLFDRLASGLVSTDEGIKAIEVAEQIELQVASLEMEIIAGDKSLSGPLRVTAPVVLVQYYFNEIFARFIAEFPEVDLTVIAANDTLNLHRREADIAIRVSDDPDENLFGRRALNMKRAFYASKEYLASKTDENGDLSFNTDLDYVSFTWWGLEVPGLMRDAFSSVRAIAHFDDMVALASAVSQGLGVSLLPCFIGEADYRLERIPALPFMPYRDLWVLTHPDLKGVERVRQFMRFAGEALDADAERFTGVGQNDQDVRTILV